MPSTLRLAKYVRILMEPLQCCKKTFERVELGLHEALVNAVIHGNHLDPTKNLRVRRIITPNWLIWQIQDEGNGISFSKRKTSLPDKLDAENGRGLFLIANCFDDVRWSKKGNRVQLACKLSNNN